MTTIQVKLVGLSLQIYNVACGDFLKNNLLTHNIYIFKLCLICCFFFFNILFFFLYSLYSVLYNSHYSILGKKYFVLHSFFSELTLFVF